MKKSKLIPLLLCFVPWSFSGTAQLSDDPAAERAGFEVAPGFDVSLFASEREGVIKPIQIRFDPRGRLWVIGSTVYPQLQPGQIPNDKVLVLEDTNHDGACDKVTVFADGLMIPTGLELGDGGTYVGQGTELLFLKDTDGDLKADERRVVLRGFGTGDNHQNINSFLWGPGGELWFSQGLHARANVETPWGIVRMYQAGLWRFRPRLKRLEGFYGSANEPQNPWGYVFTDWGEPIVIAGNNSSIIYPVPGLTSAHLDLPPALIWKNGQGRKCSGADIVETTHFPDDWQGALITGGYINNAVWALRIVEDGSGFAMEDRDPLIKSSNRNFRPVDVKFAPDGSLYICDWYNPIIGHYQASFRHPDRDKVHGRIWRVTARGRALTKPPELAGASVLALLDKLESPDRWTRHFSKRELANRPSDEVQGAVEKWIAGNRSDLGLKEALGVLQSHEIVNEPLLRRLAVAKSPGARAYAASAAGRWAEQLPDPAAILKPLASDTNARVRLQTIVAASYLTNAEAIEVVAAAAQLPSDKFIDYALKQSVYALKPVWSPLLSSGAINLANSPAQLALFLRADPSAAADRIRAILADPRSELSADRKVELWKPLLEIGNSGTITQVLLLKDPAIREPLESAALRQVRTRRIEGDSIHGAEMLRRFVQARDPFGIRLAGLWRFEAFRPEIESLASNFSAAKELREAALESLGYFRNPESTPILEKCARETSVAAPALKALLMIDPEAAARLFSETGAQLDDAAKAAVFTSFLQRKGAPAALAHAFQKQPPSGDFARAALRIMNESGSRDAALAAAFASPAQTHLTLADIPVLTQEVRARGNAARGQQVLRRAELGCLTCHALKGEGGRIGPDLGTVGTAQPIDFIIGAIIDPQKEVKEGYSATSFTTKDGDEFQGYVMREDGREVVFRQIPGDAQVTLEKSRIAQRRASGSPMPGGLADAMSREDFVDLVRFLSEQGH